MFTFNTQYKTFTPLPSDDFGQAIQDVVRCTPALPPHPNPTEAPTSPSFIISTHVDDAGFGENDHLVTRLWKIAPFPPAAGQQFDVEPHLRRIFEERGIKFYLFSMASGRMFFLGSSGKYPTNGSAYLGEVKL